MHSGVLQDEGTGALSSRKHFQYVRAARPFTPNSLSRSSSLSLSLSVSFLEKLVDNAFTLLLIHIFFCV